MDYRESEMSKRGRPPKITVDQKTLDRVRALAARGLNRKQISATMGISETLRCRLMKDEPEFREALEEGEAMGIAQVTGYLMNAAREGNVTAQIFYLKNRDPDNWKDRRDIDATHRHVREEVPIDEKMTPQEAAESYADTLRRGKGDNVVSIKRKR